MCKSLKLLTQFYPACFDSCSEENLSPIGPIILPFYILVNLTYNNSGTSRVTQIDKLMFNCVYREKIHILKMHLDMQSMHDENEILMLKIDDISSKRTSQLT